MCDTIPYPNVSGGIWPGSTEVAYTSYVIFAVGRDVLRNSQFRAWAAEHELPYKSLIGCYKGETEQSYIVAAGDFALVRPWLTGQESVLWLGPLFVGGKMYGDRSATLYYHPTSANFGEHFEDLGRFGMQPKEFAMRQPGWTYDALTEAYYTTYPAKGA